MANERKQLKGLKVGTVVTDARNKTRKVEVKYSIKVPKYGKYIKRSSFFQVHDAENVSKNGDQVEIAPCRPISKTVSWRVVRVVHAR